MLWTKGHEAPECHLNKTWGGEGDNKNSSTVEFKIIWKADFYTVVVLILWNGKVYCSIFSLSTSGV